jgi:hypothetical protein
MANRQDHDFVLTLGSEEGRTNYKVYVQGECWAYDDTDEDSDQQHSAFYRSGHVYPSYVDQIAVKGTVDAINHPGENNNPTYDIGGQRMSKQEVLDYSSGGSGGDSGSSSGGSSGGGDDVSGSFGGGERDLGGGTFDADPKHGIVEGRPAETAQHRTFEIGAGGDFGTVQDWANSIPRAADHGHEAHLQKGVHSNEPGNSVNMPRISVASAHGSVKIVGDRDNPEDYVIDAKQLNFSLAGGSAQNVGLEGVTIRGTVQARRGNLEIDDCRLIAGERWDKGDNVPLDTYDADVQILGTELKGDGAAINFVEGATVSLGSDCSVDVDGVLCTAGQKGGTLSMSNGGGGADINCSALTTTGYEPALVTVEDVGGVLPNGLDKGDFADVRP